ncbi:hypothetical protein V5785_12550 [Bacillus subtilis]
MKTAWLVTVTKKEGWKDIDVLHSFSERKDVLNYLGNLALSDDSHMKKLYEINLADGKSREMELSLNKGKLDIDYVKKTRKPKSKETELDKFLG